MWNHYWINEFMNIIPIILFGFASILFNIELISLNVELLIAVLLVTFYSILNHFIGNLIVNMLFNRNILIFESFKNIFVYNIILSNIILEICDFFEIISYDSYSHLWTTLIYTYETIYINFYNDMVSKLNKLVIMFWVLWYYLQVS